MGPSALLCALLLAACCCCRRAAGEWLRGVGGPRPERPGPGGLRRGVPGRRAGSAVRAGALRSGVRSSFPAPGRLARVPLFAASLQPGFWSTPGGGPGRRGGGCFPEREGVEPSPSGSWGALCLRCPLRGPAVGAAAGGAARAHPQIPNSAPACCWKKAACLAGGGARTPPLPPGL